jgi:short-subunit dehydrogenase
MSRDLTGRVIIITGASSGIGAVTALTCAEAGMDVVLNARRAERLAEVAHRIEQLGRRAVIVPGDVTDPGLNERLLDAAEQAFGRFDVVFANAGYGFEKPMLQISDAEHRRIWEVNYFAAVELLREAARRLIAQGRPGHLLMCSSCLAKFTLPYYAAYSATKAAQNHVCRAMRMELRPHHIEVASVHPITTSTEFFQVAARLSGDGEEAGKLNHHTPRGFIQSPQKVARAIVRCLRRPRPEVWTSFPTRLGAALMTLSPRLADVVMRVVQSKMRRDSIESTSSTETPAPTPRDGATGSPVTRSQTHVIRQ